MDFTKLELKMIEPYRILLHQKIQNFIDYKVWLEPSDIHIDEIFEVEIPEKIWIKTSLDILIEADNWLKSKFPNEYTAMMIISLTSDEVKLGINFTGLFKSMDQFDLTPPALFICPRLWPDLLKSFTNRVKLEDVQHAGTNLAVYYSEYKIHGDIEYRRGLSVFVLESLQPYLKAGDAQLS